jgi:hypothetical protein
VEVETVDPWLDPIVRWLRSLRRDESGEILILLLVIFLLWVLVAGRRVIVQ